MKFRLVFRLTAALLLTLPFSVQAAELPFPIPVVVAESESFEVVGRLDTEGFTFFVDRAAVSYTL